MRPVVLAVLVVVSFAVAMADESEEKRLFFGKDKKCKTNNDCAALGKCCTRWGRCGYCRMKKCRSDSDCDEGQCCKGRRCRTKCVKRCKSDSDCKEEQCCIKFYGRYGMCRAYLQEGDKCMKKSNWGSFWKRSCGCADGLECQVKGEGLMHYYRPGKCAVVEGSGDM